MRTQLYCVKINILVAYPTIQKGKCLMNHLSFAKYASIIHRYSNRFYDKVLSPLQFGCGQQFFLARIAENEGINLYDLAALGQFDKGTVTRAVQKLEELGYIRCITDENDRRIRRLYLTETAAPVLAYLHECRVQWNTALTEGLTAEEIAQADRLFAKLAKNAYQFHSKGEM